MGSLVHQRPGLGLATAEVLFPLRDGFSLSVIANILERVQLPLIVCGSFSYRFTCLLCKPRFS